MPCHSTTRSISGARTMARTICQDIMYSNATAWTSWVAVSEWGDNSDGLIIADHECNEYYTAKRYNALAHFSKFVPVGSKVISNEKDVNDRVAWKIKKQMGFVILNKTNCASFLTPDVIQLLKRLFRKVQEILVKWQRNLMMVIKKWMCLLTFQGSQNQSLRKRRNREFKILLFMLMSTVVFRNM